MSHRGGWDAANGSEAYGSGAYGSGAYGGYVVEMRKAASLVHAVPGLRLRLRVGRQVVGRVGVFPRSEMDRDVLSPSQFRREVGTMWQGLKTGGEHRGLLTCGLAVDVGVPPGGAITPPGVHRVPTCPGMVFAAASALAPETAIAIARDVDPQADGQIRESINFTCRRDALLDTSVYAVHAHHPTMFSHAQELVSDIAIRCQVEELLMTVTVAGHTERR